MLLIVSFLLKTPENRIKRVAKSLRLTEVEGLQKSKYHIVISNLSCLILGKIKKLLTRIELVTSTLPM